MKCSTEILVDWTRYASKDCQTTKEFLLVGWYYLPVQTNQMYNYLWMWLSASTSLLCFSPNVPDSSECEYICVCVCVWGRVCKKSVKSVSYLHHRAPQRHVVSMWLGKVLRVRVCVDMVAGVCVCVVRFQHGSLWGVQGAGHRREGVRAGIPRHLSQVQEKMTQLNTPISRSISCLETQFFSVSIRFQYLHFGIGQYWYWY